MQKFTLFALMVLLGLVIGPVAANCGEYEMGAVKATYELTSAGNAILERLFVGLPHEMVTVYYDSNGKLTMTHYCSLGNQPHMDLMNPGENNMLFVLSKNNHGLSSVNETHMHALKISDMDYKLFVISDACADKNEEVQRVLTEKVFPWQATVVTTEDFVKAVGRKKEVIAPLD